MLISWSNILSNKNIKLSKKSTIWKLHFKPEDVIREDAFLQDDGTVIYVKRGKPKLKKKAIPSIFPPQKVPYYQQMERRNNNELTLILHLGKVIHHCTSLSKTDMKKVLSYF